jgi:hypothetical protein
LWLREDSQKSHIDYFNEKGLQVIVPDGFLMIEPRGAGHPPIIDEITRKVAAAWRFSTPSEHGYRGMHQCVCGALSDNRDHFVTVNGKCLLTNSLMVHYAACHRNELPEEELQKIAALDYGEQEPLEQEVAAY